MVKNTKQPKVHLLHGFVGVGKTTFARRLEQEFNAVRFTHDEWIHRLFGPNPRVGKFDAIFARVDDLIWRHATRLIELDVDVIIDHGFWSRASRDQARERATELGAEAVLYRVSCPEDEVRQRVALRSKNVPNDSVWINKSAFASFRERFEPLQEDEECVEILGSAGGKKTG